MLASQEGSQGRAWEMFGDRPLREVVPLFDIQAEEAGEGDKMTKAEFKKLSVVLGKK